jgi:hypothetical protein
MRVDFDFYVDARGGWKVETYDPPDRTGPSSALPYASADVAVAAGQTPAGARRVSLHGVALNEHASAALSLESTTIQLFAYHALDRDAMIAFEQEVEPRYGDHYAQLGVLYPGVFDVVGLAGPYVGELLLFHWSLEMAKNFARTEPAADIAAVEEQSRALQDRTRARHIAWLWH